MAAKMEGQQYFEVDVMVGGQVRAFSSLLLLRVSDPHRHKSRDEDLFGIFYLPCRPHPPPSFPSISSPQPLPKIAGKDGNTWVEARFNHQGVTKMLESEVQDPFGE